MKIVKRIFAVIFILLIIIAGAAIILPFIFKDDIIQLVKDETNKNVNAKVEFGEFDLSLITNFPDFSFVINDVSVAGIEEFEGDTLMNLGTLKLTVDVMSVINGSGINIKTISIDRLDMLAKVLKEGKANWDIAKPSEEQPAEEEKPEDAAGDEAPFKMSLKKFEIKNTNIIYDDQQGGMYAEVKDLNFYMKGDFTADFTSLSVNTTISSLTFVMDKVKYLNKTSMEFKADLDADIKNSKYTFKENEFKLNQLVLGWDGWVAMPNDSDIDLDLKFNTRKTTFKSILSLVPAVYSKDFENVQTDGKLALNGYSKGTYKENRLPQFGVNLIIENAMFKYPDLPASVDNINIKTAITNPGGSEDNTVIDVSQFHIELAKNPVDIHLVLRTPISDPAIDCGIKGEIDLEKLKDVVPLDEGESMSGLITSDIVLKGNLSTIENEKYEEFNATGNLKITNMNYTNADLPQGVKIIQMEMKFSPKYVDLASFECILGKSDISANGVIENFIPYALTDSAVLKGRYQLKSKLMDLNEFMDEGVVDSAAAEGVAAEDTASLSVIEVPDNIDFELNSWFDKMIYDKIEITKAGGLLRVKDNRVVMENLNMYMLGGTTKMNGFYDTKSPKIPVVDFDLDIANWDIPLTFNAFNTVKKLAPIAENCRGSFSTVLKFVSRLDEKMEPVFASLNGGGTIKSDNVVIEGSKTINKLADAMKQEKYKRLQLENIDATYEFREGRLWLKPFEVKIGQSKATIWGSNGFDQTLEYTIRMTVPTSEFGGEAAALLGSVAGFASQAGLSINIESVDVEILITGTVMEPKVSIGKIAPSGGEGKTTKEQLKDEIKKQIGDVKEKVEEKVKEEIGKVKEDALKQAREEADKIVAEAEKQAQQVRNEAKNLSDKVKNEGYAQAKNLEDQAKNPIAKAGAKIGADKLRKESDKKAQDIIDEGNKKAQGIVDTAKKKSDDLIKKAENK